MGAPGETSVSRTVLKDDRKVQIASGTKSKTKIALLLASLIRLWP